MRPGETSAREGSEQEERTEGMSERVEDGVMAGEGEAGEEEVDARRVVELMRLERVRVRRVRSSDIVS